MADPSLQNSPALWGEGMVQSADARLFLIEKELLQLQLHLCAGNCTFRNTIKEGGQQSGHVTVLTQTTCAHKGLTFGSTLGVSFTFIYVKEIIIDFFPPVN